MPAPPSSALTLVIACLTPHCAALPRRSLASPPPVLLLAVGACALPWKGRVRESAAEAAAKMPMTVTCAPWTVAVRTTGVVVASEEVDVAVQALISLLEPLLVVVLGGVVGTIVLALFLPLVKMIESVSGGKI